MDNSGEIVPTEELTYLLEISTVRHKHEIERHKNKMSRCLISYVKHRHARRIWEEFIIMVALYSVFVIPIRIGINKSLWGTTYDVIDLITWLIYLADVFINLRTTFVNNFGLEVTDSKTIMKHYIFSTRFVLDGLSLLNFPTLMLPNPPMIMTLFGLLKTSRFLRANALIA